MKQLRTLSLCGALGALLLLIMRVLSVLVREVTQLMLINGSIDVDAMIRVYTTGDFIYCGGSILGWLLIAAFFFIAGGQIQNYRGLSLIGGAGAVVSLLLYCVQCIVSLVNSQLFGDPDYIIAVNLGWIVAWVIIAVYFAGYMIVKKKYLIPVLTILAICLVLIIIVIQTALVAFETTSGISVIFTWSYLLLFSAISILMAIHFLQMRKTQQ